MIVCFFKHPVYPIFCGYQMLGHWFNESLTNKGSIKDEGHEDESTDVAKSDNTAHVKIFLCLIILFPIT